MEDEKKVYGKECVTFRVDTMANFSIKDSQFLYMNTNRQSKHSGAPSEVRDTSVICGAYKCSAASISRIYTAKPRTRSRRKRDAIYIR